MRKRAKNRQHDSILQAFFCLIHKVIDLFWMQKVHSLFMAFAFVSLSLTLHQCLYVVLLRSPSIVSQHTIFIIFFLLLYSFHSSFSITQSKGSLIRCARYSFLLSSVIPSFMFFALAPFRPIQGLNEWIRSQRTIES